MPNATNKRPLISSLARNQNWLLLLSAVVIIFLIFMVAIIAAHRLHTYSSDDVAQQTILMNDGKYGPRDAWFGVDNFLLKMPVYQVVNATLGQSRTALLVTTLFFNALAFSAVVGALFVVWRDELKSVGKKIPGFVVAGLIGLLWFSSLGGDMANALINPNVRNAEIGICLLLAVLALKQVTTQKPKIWVSILVSIGIGLFVFNDPYFLFTLFAALGAVPIYYFFFNGQGNRVSSLHLYALLGGALVVYKLAGVIFLAFGLHVYPTGVVFANLTTFGTNITNVVSAFVVMFHANFFGKSLSLETVAELFNAVVSITLVVAAIYYLAKRRLNTPYIALIVLIIITTIVLYGLTTNSDSASTSRYLILIPFVLIAIIPFVLREIQNARIKRLLVAFIVVAAILNVFVLVLSFKTPNLAANITDEHTIAAVKATEARKGYAGYWDSNITTYLSRNSIMTVPITCNGTQLQIDYWLMDSAWLTRKAASTYLVVNKNDETFRRCDDAQLAVQFGAPSQKIVIDPARTIYIYDYDIYTKIPQRLDSTHP